jgi:muramidase (phage lysozyme)
MSIVADNLRKSSINIGNISKSISSTRSSVSSVGESVNNISKTIAKNIKVKNELFQTSYILDSRRREASKRKELEDQLEASKVSTSVSRGLNFANTSEKGPLGRLVSFLGFLTAGWIVENLPTWMFMGKEFISRINKVNGMMGDFMNSLSNIFTSFGYTLSNSFDAIIRLDFNEFSEGSVTKSFEDLSTSISILGADIYEAFSVFSKPLTENIDTEEQAPRLGEERTDTLYPPIQQEGSISSTRIGTKEQRAMLDAIAFAEGTRDQPNNGYKTLFGFGQFNDYSRHPDKVVRSGGYASAAAGRYQFMPGTFNRLAKKLGLKDFSPASQDKAAIELAREYGITQELLSKEGMSPRVSALLGRQWASFPGKTIGLDQPTKQLKSVQQAYQKSLGTSQQTPTQIAPAPSTLGTGQSFRPLPQGSFKGGESQRFNAPRPGRKHLGIDITESNWKPGSDPRIPVVAIRGGVVSSRNYVPGSQYLSGLVIDQDDGYSVRYLHMTPSVSPGQKVSAGQRIGRLVNLGDQTHLHIELYSGSKLLDPTDYIKTIERGEIPRAIARQPSTTLAQISSPPKPSQTAPITPTRTGPMVAVIDDRRPQQPQQVYPSISSQTPQVSNVNEFTLLNNFIKNKLLLDLAYL